MKPVLASVLAVALAGTLPHGDALASQEQIHDWRSLTTRVDAGSAFGTVDVTARIKGNGFARRLGTLQVNVGGKRIAVPTALLAKLGNPQLRSLHVRSERGYGKHPWLYVVFTLGPTKLNTKWTPSYAYVSIQNGKLVRVQVKRKHGARWTFHTVTP